MKKKFLITCLLFCFLLSGCGKDNKYMIKDTLNGNSVTIKEKKDIILPDYKNIPLNINYDDYKEDLKIVDKSYLNQYLIIEYLINNSTVPEMTDEYYENYYNENIDFYTNSVKASEKTEEELFKDSEYENLDDYIRTEAEHLWKEEQILMEIARRENLSANEDDYNEFMKDYLLEGESVEEFEKSLKEKGYTKEKIMDIVTMSKVSTYLEEINIKEG